LCQKMQLAINSICFSPFKFIKIILFTALHFIKTLYYYQIG
jgi:hypothetical protein